MCELLRRHAGVRKYSSATLPSAELRITRLQVRDVDPKRADPQTWRLTGHEHRTAVPVRCSGSASTSPRRAHDRGARTQFAIDVENRGRIVLDQTELGDDFARDLLFFDLLGQEPL